ncbi:MULTISPECIES: ribosomal protein L7/L12 [unclassified Rhizobacter]|uniref:ribosomal protein L7/L12 n=1 Tax=unclassified Rhizobacter TaxID=2640088 RepID=UPI0006F50A74|nr:MULTISPECIES: ribosomal protein L7/L12 [unclassified Rhizobacter]KQU73634.1 hypothetical protein ASC88_27870 [Rhizobacter sp. Root29]KQW08899.1 hypothetical protein ASC98_24405 [Rhizobacter sp. Root1238]KRB21577.1 hypothetical protein ASE08_21640 [Rhizobacter sp. Root16D2]
MQRSPDSLSVEVVDALRRGNKIEAIKLLRDATGLGLSEAKDAVERVESGESPALQERVRSSTMSPEIEAALQQGNKIEAIRLLRAQTGVGLKEAKEAVDAASDGRQATAPGGSPGEVKRSGSSLKWFVAVIFAAAMLIYFVLKPA